MTSTSRLVSTLPLGSEKSQELFRAHAQGLSLVELSRKFKTDLALIPHNFKAPRLIVFDMDSTLIKAEVIDELAEEAGIGEKVKVITEKAMRGELNFDESLEQRVLLLRGLPETHLKKVYERIELNPGVEAFMKRAHELGVKTAIISGGFTYFAHLFSKRLHMNYVFSNQLELKGGELTGRVSGEIVNADRKSQLLEEIAAKEGINLTEVVAVGDGANDIPMLTRAGVGVAYYGKEKVQQAADALINYGTMTSLLSFFSMDSEHGTV